MHCLALLICHLYTALALLWRYGCYGWLHLTLIWSLMCRKLSCRTLSIAPNNIIYQIGIHRDKTVFVNRASEDYRTKVYSKSDMVLDTVSRGQMQFWAYTLLKSCHNRLTRWEQTIRKQQQVVQCRSWSPLERDPWPLSSDSPCSLITSSGPTAIVSSSTPNLCRNPFFCAPLTRQIDRYGHRHALGPTVHAERLRPPTLTHRHPSSHRQRLRLCLRWYLLQYVVLFVSSSR